MMTYFLKVEVEIYFETFEPVTSVSFLNFILL